MIVHVCGTMGSGKTTLVRTFMAGGGRPWTSITLAGRRLPIGYTTTDGPQLVVAGAYEDGLQTSGCDTFKDTPATYAMTQGWAERGASVLYEGLFMMNHTRGLALARAVGVERMTVLRLTASVEECRAGVITRRAAQGNHEPLPARFEEGLKGNDVRAANYTHKMKALGCPVHRVSRADALAELNLVLS